MLFVFLFCNCDWMYSWVNEICVVIKGDGLISGVFGIYVFYQCEMFVQDQIMLGFDVFILFFGIGMVVDFGVQLNLIFDGRQDIKQCQFVVFGEVIWKIIDMLLVFGGLCVFDFKQDFELCYVGLVNDGLMVKNSMIKESGFNFKFQVNYKFFEYFLVYVMVVKGFWFGGVNELVLILGVFGMNCVVDFVLCGFIGFFDIFKFDMFWNYELGFKSKIDNCLMFNVLVYQIDWKNIQMSVFLFCGFVMVVNVGMV